MNESLMQNTIRQLQQLVAVRNLMDAAVAEEVKANVASYQDGVMCMYCSVGYGERDEYPCVIEGTSHEFSPQALIEAEEHGRSIPVEEITFNVNALKVILGLVSGNAAGPSGPGAGDPPPLPEEPVTEESEDGSL